MATTIASGTLTVKLTESVSLNGTSYAAVNNLTIAAINEIQQRIVTIPNSTLVKLYDFTGVGTGAGSYDRTTLKYLRITNKATGIGVSQGVASGTVGTPTLENLVTVTAYSGLVNNVDVECYVAMT